MCMLIFIDADVHTAPPVCAELPDCRYDPPERGVSVLTPDSLDFANSVATCELACTNERRFVCRSYTFDRERNRCYLSGDDAVSLGRVTLPPLLDAVTSQRVCTLGERTRRLR